VPPARSTSSLRTSPSPPASLPSRKNSWTPAVSGAKSSRPARTKLLEAARLRQIDLVLVLRLDRWGRAVADCVCPQGGGKLTDAAVHDIDNVGVQGVRKGDDRRVRGGGCEEGAGSRQALRLSPAFPGGTASLS